MTCFTIAAAQYPIEQLADWEAYAAKVTKWVEAAAAGGAALAVFPEYGAIELASLDPATMAELERRGVAHRLLVVGDGPARARFEAQVPRAIFTGFLDGEKLARAYASIDILLNPSTTETFGNINLEANASGVPVVAAVSGVGSTVGLVAAVGVAAAAGSGGGGEIGRAHV